jgi:RNA polymerase sigma-70 factor (sigma-E family)
VDAEAEDDFRDYVASRYPSLVRTAYLMCGNQGHAEDLVQSALAKTYLAWHRIRRESVDPYVRRILHNDYVSERRRHWWREIPAEQLADRAHGAYVDDVRRVDERDALFQALRALPVRQRAAVVLRHYEDLSEAQTAEILGCSIGTVKSLTARGLGQLRTVLPADQTVTQSPRKEGK